LKLFKKTKGGNSKKQCNCPICKRTKNKKYTKKNKSKKIKKIKKTTKNYKKLQKDKNKYKYTCRKQNIIATYKDE
jgi:hypothetical protein